MRRALASGPAAGAFALAVLFGLDFVGATLDFMGFSDEKATNMIVHRYGRMEPGERIVLVAVGSPHREAAFEACEFLVDWLKTKAPFWKMEETPAGGKWVGAHDDDDQAAARWEKNRR